MDDKSRAVGSGRDPDSKEHDIKKHTAAARRNMVTRTPFFLTPGPVVVGGHNCGETVRSSAIPGSVHKKEKKKKKRTHHYGRLGSPKMTVIMSVAPYPDIRVFVADFPMGRDSLIKCPFVARIREEGRRDDE
ncbi:hypothetical protein MCOR25_005928 [Pyricularia grisea]|nr:hypothetical protein MCOR25_005928 [Pyricularia grisea]